MPEALELAKAAAALDDRDGWLNPDSPQWFADYAEVVFKALADRKKHVYDEDLEALVDQEIASAHDRIKVVALTVIAAAAVMVAVFFTVALSGPLPPKEMGIILGVAVLLDALLEGYDRLPDDIRAQVPLRRIWALGERRSS